MLAFMLVSSSYGSSKDVNTEKKDIQVADMEMEQTVSLDRVKIFGWLGEGVDRSYRAV